MISMIMLVSQKNKYSIHFTKEKAKFFLGLHYNSYNGYLYIKRKQQRSVHLNVFMFLFLFNFTSEGYLKI